jgi:hypothetical protein
MMEQRGWSSLDLFWTPRSERHLLLEDLSVVLPTLGKPILEACLVKMILGSH